MIENVDQYREEVEKELNKPADSSWLNRYAQDENDFEKYFPINSILENSLFYGACACDFRAVNIFKRSINSYVYSDFAYPYEEIKIKLHRNELCNYIPKDAPNLDKIKLSDYSYIKNYALKRERKVRIEELGMSEWRTRTSPTVFDGDLETLNFWKTNNTVEPYISWSILERIEENDSDPQYISFLYLGYELAEAYQVLYNQFEKVPLVIYFYNPGMGYWDYKYKRGKFVPAPFFQKIINENRKGIPKYYFSDNWVNEQKLENYDLIGDSRYFYKRIKNNKFIEPKEGLDYEFLWQKIIDELNNNSRHFQTVRGKWFQATTRYDELIIISTKHYSPSIEIKKEQVISKQEFLDVANFYIDWLNGVKGTTKEAQKVSRNVGYLFVIIDEYRQIFMDYLY